MQSAVEFCFFFSAETNTKKKNALRAKVNEYIARAESLKKFVCISSQNNDIVNSDINGFDHITEGAVFRELSK